MGLKKIGILPSLSKCFDFSKSSVSVFWEMLAPTMPSAWLMAYIDLTFSS